MKLKKTFLAAALALAAQASWANVICDSCDFLGLPSVATFLGAHDPAANDNSTFANSATGTNGTFSNWWVFRLVEDGQAALNAIFLPISNISNFSSALWSLTSANCAANTGTSGGACLSFGPSTLLAEGTTSPTYATTIAPTSLDAGFYAFNISGLISGLGPIQPASYAGNLQVQNPIPEPSTYALMGVGVLVVGAMARRRRQQRDA